MLHSSAWIPKTSYKDFLMDFLSQWTLIGVVILGGEEGKKALIA